MIKITSRILREAPRHAAVYGEITFKELKTDYRKRMKRIIRQEDPNTCKILKEEYQYNSQFSEKKECGFIQTDDGSYLKVTKSKFNALPFPLMLFILNNLKLFGIITATAKVATIAVTSIIIAQTPIAQDFIKGILEPNKITNVGDPNDNNHNNSTEDPTTSDGTIKDYEGNELDDLEDTTINDNIERYTIIDGIIYQGEYLTINKGTAIPLGNNPENEKTGVSLEFIIQDGDKVIFKTPKLKPGTGVDFIPGQYLGAGLHNLRLTINVFHENGSQDIGYSQDISINILE